MVPFLVVSALSIFFGRVMASEMVSRIVVPLPKLMKYSEAADACEAEGMRLARFSSVKESIEYATSTLVEKNLDRVWIGAMGEDQRERLALEVFEGLPITYKVEQVYEEDKMLAVLCEPVFMDVKSEPIGEPVLFEEALKELAINEKDELVSEAAINESEEIVICEFEVDSEEKSVQILENTETGGATEADENGLDLMKSKGRSGYERRNRSRCSRSRRSCSSSSSSSSSSECERSRRRRGGYNYRRRNRNRNRSSSSSSCSSSSSTECAVSDFSCDPFERSGSSSSSSESRCRRSNRNCNRRSRRRSNRNRRSSSSSTSSSNSSSSEQCGTGRCGAVRGESKFFREIRLSR